MTRRRKQTTRSRRPPIETVAGHSRRTSDPHARQDDELESRVRFALREVCEALMEAGREEQSGEAALDLTEVSDLAH